MGQELKGYTSCPNSPSPETYPLLSQFLGCYSVHARPRHECVQILQTLLENGQFLGGVAALLNSIVVLRSQTLDICLCEIPNNVGTEPE